MPVGSGTFGGGKDKAGMQTPAPVVHVIDDAEDIRDLVTEILTGVDLRCVAWENPEDLLGAAPSATIDVLVIDVRLRGMSGIELARRLRDAGIHVPVIFISGVSDVPVAVEAMKLGAVDFLQKPFRAQTLIDVVQAALRQHRSEGEREATVAAHRELVAKLSPREMEVFLGVVAGKANKVLAIDLGLSEKTIEDHRSRMMAKLGASSVADLVKIGVLAGVCDPLAERSTSH